jgi:uroporphyrinogen decarboxylase
LRYFMTKQMLSRERVHKTLNFQEPDRLPTAIGGGPYGIVDEVYFKLLKYFGLGEPVAPFRQGHNISYMDDRLLEKLGTDLRFVYPALSPSSPIHHTDDPNTFLDAFGQKWKRALPYFYTDKGILTNAKNIDQIDELVNWPDPSDPRWFAEVQKRAQELRGSTDFWITARMVTSHGPYQMACDLRGTEDFMVDLVTNPDFAIALLNRIGDSLCGFLDQYLLACGKCIDMIELPGDDYAGNENLVFSPQMFRKFIQPIIIRMMERIKTFNPEIKIMLHSDGAITKLIPDLISSGIDVIHPLEPLLATDQSAVKKICHDELAILGGIDISHAMTGTKEDVMDEVNRCVKSLAPGGGYILAPSNHLQSDVPPENIVNLFEYARVLGVYPIKKNL